MADAAIGEVKMLNVRMSFEHVWTPTASVKNGPLKYRSSFIIDPSTPEGKKTVKRIEAAIAEVEKEKWGKTGVKFKEDRHCFYVGEDLTDKDGEVREEYAGMYVLKAANSDRPVIRDRDGKTPLAREDGKIYSGAFVNAIVRLYGINDPAKGGNGMFASLEGIQFVKHGDAFRGGGISDNAFEDLGDDDDDDLVD